MRTALAYLLKNLPLPLKLIVAGYIRLRSLDIALRPARSLPQSHGSGVDEGIGCGLFPVVLVFVIAEIFGYAGIITSSYSVSCAWLVLCRHQQLK